jgi:hypothetical protein
MLGRAAGGAMHETATLHFDLSNLSPDQPFTLHVGSRRYHLAPQTLHTLARSRRDNAALALLPDHRVTHFAWPVRLPANCPALLRVTAPKLRPDELVDRLVLTSVHLPRRHRIAGLARRQRRLQGHRMPVPAKLAAYGVISGLPPDKVLIDIGDKLHGTGPLAQSIYDESQAYEASSSKCNWVNSQPGVDWKTGQPSNPVYFWSDKTKDNLGPPLRSAAAAEQERSRPGEPALVGAGRITQVPMMIASTPDMIMAVRLPPDGSDPARDAGDRRQDKS